MALKKWLGWTAGWCLACSVAVVPQFVRAQSPDETVVEPDVVVPEYGTVYGGPQPHVFDPPVPYGYATHQAGPDPYWVSPIPERPQLFSSADPFGSAFRSYEGFFLRTEYLNWDYNRPGDVLLGAPQFNVADPRVPREVFDGFGNSLGFASVPSLDQMNIDNVAGIRGTAGIPLIFGSMEASIFGFAKNQETFVDTNMLGTEQQPFLGTSTLVDGAVSDSIYLYNDTYRAVFNSRFWGSEANFFLEGPSSNYISLNPMLGFRYMDFREDLLQTGRFTPDPGTGLPPVISHIDSFSTNRMFLPQIGLRTTIDTPYVTINFDPKFGLGANSFDNRVRTLNFRSNGDPEVITKEGATTLCPMVDLGVNGRLHITPNFSMVVGYNFIWVGNISRPQDNINYGDNGPFPTLPGVVLNTHKQDMRFQGITIGGEIRFH